MSDALLEQAPKSDHYRRLAIQPLEYIEANNLSYHEGNVIKYVSRWRFKDGIDDLKKAKFYVERLIELAERDAS